MERKGLQSDKSTSHSDDKSEIRPATAEEIREGQETLKEQQTKSASMANLNSGAGT